MPEGSRTGGAKRLLRAAFTERLGYKAAALFFATVLWLVASVEEPTEELVPVRIGLSLDPSVSLVGEPPTLRALVVGRSREVIKLFDQPAVVRRTVPADAPPRLRFQFTPGDVALPPGVEVTVRDVQPRTVTLRFAARPVVRDTTAPVVDIPPVPADSLSGSVTPDTTAADTAEQQRSPRAPSLRSGEAPPRAESREPRAASTRNAAPPPRR